MPGAGSNEIRHEGSTGGHHSHLMPSSDQLAAQANLVRLDPSDIERGQQVEDPHSVGL